MLAKSPQKGSDIDNVYVGADRAQIEEALGGAVGEGTGYYNKKRVKAYKYQVYIRNEKEKDAGFGASISRAFLGFRKETFIIKYDSQDKAISIKRDSISAI